jgi:glyoxylase-like metal-dependent hydrolase (beta-lactamase superfamily II)
LGDLIEDGVPAMGWNIAGADLLGPDEQRDVGGISFRTFDLSGHYSPALGFLFIGFSRPVLAVGDAVFAGSIGGCKTPEGYRLALQRIHEVCSVLPDETILLTGHGPATTLGEERRSNPFLAGRI